MSDLDKQVKDAIKHLEDLESEYQQKIFDDTVTISNLYPLDKITTIAIECAEEQRIQNNLHIAFHRKAYSEIKSFKEKKDYYNKTLTTRELGFRLAQEKLNNFINNPKVKPYEYWVTEFTLAEIERKGIKDFIRDELLFGNLI